MKNTDKKIKNESHLRSWTKSIVWRIIGILLLWVISWVVLKDWKEVTLITIVFHVIRFILYYFHERVWDKIHWGITKHPLSGINVKQDLTPEDKRIIREQLERLGYIN